MGVKRDAEQTRQRILDISGRLFAEQGYAGTTIADIARELGTTTAALYYHFKSKVDILDSLLATPLAAYTKLAEQARSLPREELLVAYIDFVAETRQVVPFADPTVRALIDERLPHTPQQMIDGITTSLAGPNPTRARAIGAKAAVAVVKECVPLNPTDRDEILAAALRALGD
ncbi:hypothetical protein GCM10029964_098340 [Kibdelosporangium lantanae]